MTLCYTQSMTQTTATDQAVDNRCRGCNGELRWDTDHYDYPRWVHVRIVDLVYCKL